MFITLFIVGQGFHHVTGKLGPGSVSLAIEHFILRNKQNYLSCYLDNETLIIFTPAVVMMFFKVEKKCLFLKFKSSDFIFNKTSVSLKSSVRLSLFVLSLCIIVWGILMVNDDKCFVLV